MRCGARRRSGPRHGACVPGVAPSWGSRALGAAIGCGLCGLGWLLGCGDDRPSDASDAMTSLDDAGSDALAPRDGAPSTADASPDGSPTNADASVDPPRFVLAARSPVALPYAVAGSVVGSATLALREVGGAAGTEGLRIEVTGDFALDGDRMPLGANEERSFDVRFTGMTTTPANAIGLAAIEADGARVDVVLAAVLGAPDLPVGLDWLDEEGVVRVTAAFPSAPFPDGVARYDDPSVLVAFPRDLDATSPVPIVTHLHGHNARLSRTVPAQHLVRQLALSGRNAVLVVPQGPTDAADGDFGKLDGAGGFARLARDVLAVLYRDGYVRVPSAGAVVLTSHSGGYGATANIVDRGGLPVTAVHLFDSLYGRADVFEGFVARGHTFRSIYTSGGGTGDQNRSLAARLASAGTLVADVFDDDSLASARTTIGFTTSSHDGCIRDERMFARWLVASGLPRRPLAPPELLVTAAEAGGARVAWRAEAAAFDGAWRLEGSDDGTRWDTLLDTAETSALVERRPMLRVRAIDGLGNVSEPSDTYGATGDTWLVVDAFDRVLDGSYRAATHDLAARLGFALDAPFSIASNEAVGRGDVELATFSGVVWMLGDESSGDRTFDARERDLVSAYVATGGALVVSGSEVGFAADPAWLSGTLGARYVADDAGTGRVESWTFGVIYEEDYPDVLDGDELLWRYSTGGGAAVRSRSNVIVVGFPLDSMPDADRRSALLALRALLGV